MTSLADRTITALRDLHDELATLVPTLSEAQLTGPSGASEWTVAQVLSHLGSGAEIALASWATALDGAPEPAADFNQSVWDRWNALGPQEQADGFLASDATLVAKVEALTAEQRESVQVKLGFLPFPLGVDAVAGLRLNEVAHHSWDARVALDPAAGLGDEAATVLADLFSGPLGFLLGFVGKADQLATPAVVDVHGYGIAIADGVTMTPTATDATATFAGPLEAAMRLLSGRLTPAYTAPGTEVTGNVSLEDLRRVFPGF